MAKEKFYTLDNISNNEYYNIIYVERSYGKNMSELLLKQKGNAKEETYNG